MRTSNELYKAHRAIIDECKADICRELERIGRTELWFDDSFPVLVDNNSQAYGYESGATAETITSISITESGKLLYLWTEEENEIEISDVVPSEWLYIWQQVEEECKSIPTAYYTEEVYHNKEKDQFSYYLGEEIEETKVEGEQEAKEQLIHNYNAYLRDMEPEDFLPIFFLSTRENGEYKRKFALFSTELAKTQGYTTEDLAKLINNKIKLPSQNINIWK